LGLSNHQKFTTMQRSITFSLYALFLLSLTITGSFAQDYRSVLSDSHGASEETHHLFNGTDLTGWYTFLEGRGRNNDPKDVFTVQDGMIRISGEEWGCITTNKEYEDYHIIVEYKWGTLTYPPRKNKARDCGLLLHSRGEDGGAGGRWIHSIECQMIEGGTGDIIVVGDGSDRFSVTAPVASEKQGNSYVYQPGGQKVTINSGRINWIRRDPNWKDTLGFRGKQDVENPVGEWNTLECIADGDQLTILLNGQVVNKATKLKPRKGKIQIQSESAEVFIRRVDLMSVQK